MISRDKGRPDQTKMLGASLCGNVGSLKKWCIYPFLDDHSSNDGLIHKENVKGTFFVPLINDLLVPQPLSQLILRSMGSYDACSSHIFKHLKPFTAGDILWLIAANFLYGSTRNDATVFKFNGILHLIVAMFYWRIFLAISVLESILSKMTLQDFTFLLNTTCKESVLFLGTKHKFGYWESMIEVENKFSLDIFLGCQLWLFLRSQN